ncbi:RNA export factor, nucleoporin Rae1 [Schizosaccharomyces osmophilus]|uniref:RNA export factor, nucleoporin Rae1 n=1 Tax=Schizosaccharomyces osmophilus TaxID=2545709 RepID=A0AAE9WBN7_9SCHI|nr:RNA export factor, nucleoporin Rae1 [Schizosaccharomyces osmophilus]WBW73402.1 RNA export factor, nucleoporin Rae1 [Schizosaccharomyces osmophilus]
MSLFGQAATTTVSSATGDLKSDVEVPQPPEDSISDLAFSPHADYLAASSWDSKVRIYEVQSTGQSVGKALYDHQGPVLSVHWSRDGTKLASGSTDKSAKVFDIQTGQNQQVAAHDDSIRCVRFVESIGSTPILATGSWDKTLKYWDLRQPAPIATVNLPERVYTMDSVHPLLVIGTAERNVCVVNLSEPTKIFKVAMSPLKFQTRSIACFAKADGYAIGSVEGRCAIQNLDEKIQKDNFSFRCHRTQGTGTSDVYSVNSLAFHPQYGTFSTAGSDGTFSFWDKDSHQRLKSYPNVGGPIACTAFNRTGDIFAYAVSYDWSKGYSFHTPQHPNKIMLHPVPPEEMKPRPKRR